MTERKLNLDISGAVSELELLLKQVLPKNIMYQMILGKGLEFDGYRDYTFTDDAILIDWKATVRAKKTLVRKYIEERDLKFMFLIDVSDNMVFGSTEKLKCEYSAELCAAVSHLILTNGDRFGAVFYNDKIVNQMPPNVGKKQFEAFVHKISDPLIYEGPSNLNNILDEVTKSFSGDTSMIFIVSDFINVDETYKKNLEILAGRFEVVAIVVRDPLDINLPDLNKEIVIENPSTHEKLLINPSIARGTYNLNALKQFESVKEIFNDNNIDFIELTTDKNFSDIFAAFLQERVSGGRIVKTKNVR